MQLKMKLRMSPVRSLQNIWTRWPSFLSGEVEIDSLGGRGDVRQDLPLLHLIIFQREVISDDVKDKFRRAGSIAEQFKCLWNSQVIPILKKLNFSRLWSMSLWTIRGKKAKYYFCSTTYLPKAERYNDKDKKIEPVQRMILSVARFLMEIAVLVKHSSDR